MVLSKPRRPSYRQLSWTNEQERFHGLTQLLREFIYEFSYFVVCEIFNTVNQLALVRSRGGKTLAMIRLRQ
jgi:hypothetical protein